MALYANDKLVRQSKADPDLNAPPHRPGTPAPHSGIYACATCGLEITSEVSNPLPPSHADAAVGHTIEWKLLVRTEAPKEPAMTTSRAKQLIEDIFNE